MFCSKCGQEIHDEAVVCVHCGCSVRNEPGPKPGDRPNVWFLILGILFPMVGLILFLMYKKEYPKRAKSAAKGAIIGIIAYVLLSLILAAIALLFTFLSVLPVLLIPLSAIFNAMI